MLIYGTMFKLFSRAVPRTTTNIKIQSTRKTLRSLPSETQWRSYRRRQFNPQAYQTTVGLFRRWAARPTFYYECAGLGGVGAGLYVYNLEEVPVTGRKRFNIFGEEFLLNQDSQLYHQTLQEFRGQLLPENHPLHRRTEAVLERLIPHSGLSPEHNHWRLHIIDDVDLVNAFVIPGGKVFVATGMFKVCTNDDMLAAVLGHEISHNVAKHAAERMSRVSVLVPFAYVASILAGLGDFSFVTRIFVDLALVRPNGRTQESEADHIGLLMMADACFDPEAAIELWERMDQLAERAPPQMLSTHPSNYNRKEAIRGWMVEAEAKRQSSECGPTAGWGTSNNPIVVALSTNYNVSGRLLQKCAQVRITPTTGSLD